MKTILFLFVLYLFITCCKSNEFDEDLEEDTNASGKPILSFEEGLKYVNGNTYYYLVQVYNNLQKSRVTNIVFRQGIPSNYTVQDIVKTGDNTYRLPETVLKSGGIQPRSLFTFRYSATGLETARWYASKSEIIPIMES
ncbi:hypothetical protein DLAC_01867 [Tieghemostelium lacteum]|uniref:Uncharacterized protein n=1 Tax=Tieghemostelium lacteum TaxID=361077 RepID=A0A152A6K8_TIELA|nr:hypothetical protein DLAC_01867 [Tieghemostelium lacteum]|eukprot:KYR01850.1 hypothetical protein DLAC_01867 [Tieghemostelium lacteum]